MRILLLSLSVFAAWAQPQTLVNYNFGGRELDVVNAAAADAAGNLYVAGQTYSRDFPVAGPEVTSCHLGSLGGCADAFAAKISADGARLVYSIFIGTPGSDEATGIAVTPDGAAWVAGSANNGIFLLRLSPDGREEVRRTITTYPLVRATGLALDRFGYVYVTGETLGSLPLVRPLQSSMGAPSCTAAGGSTAFSLDAFVMKFSPTGETLYSTYLGGSGNDGGQAIGTDPEGNIYVAGHTSSRDLALANPAQQDYGGGEPTGAGQCEGGDGFLAKISADGAKLIYSTYSGTGARERITSIDVSPEGYATAIRSGPTGRLQTFSPEGELLWERDASSSLSVARDRAGKIYLAIPGGYMTYDSAALRPQYPMAGTALQTRVVRPLASGLVLLAGHVGDSGLTMNAAVTLLRPADGPCPSAVLVNAASYRGPYVAADSLATLFGCGLEGVTEVLFAGAPARVLSGSATQINLVLPPNLPPGPMTVTLVRGPGSGASSDVQIARTAPALFTADASGTGSPAANVLRVDPDGRQTWSLASAPIDLGGAGQRTFLLLYGTGFRHAGTARVWVRANGVELPVLGYAAQSEYPGLDQVNVELPRTLAGAGAVDLQLGVGGRLANPVTVLIR